MFIDAADKYYIVNLKLEAEEALVDSTSINLDNAMDMDDLLYADSGNCALLKEAAMNYLADKHTMQQLQIFLSRTALYMLWKISSLHSAETARMTQIDTSMSRLPRKLDKMGLEVGGRVLWGNNWICPEQFWIYRWVAFALFDLLTSLIFIYTAIGSLDTPLLLSRILPF